MGQDHKSKANRRNMLKGIGIGALGVPLAMNPATAQPERYSLSVDIEAPRDRITGEFRGRLSVSGLQPGSNVVYMIVPRRSDGEFIDEIRSDVVEANSSSESYYSDPTWDPSDVTLGIGEWPSGTYTLYATVADGVQEAFGVAISDSFEVSP